MQKRNLNLLAWDWKAITLCIVIAASFWLFNSLNKTYTTHISYPVTFKTNPQQVVALQELPTHLDLEVTGQGWSILRKNFNYDVAPLPISLPNPLSNKKVDTKQFVPRFTAHIKDLKINHIVPDTLTFHFDKVVSKEIYLKVSPNLPLKDGFRVVSVLDIYPNKVLFSGAASVLAKYKDTLLVHLQEEEKIDKSYGKIVKLAYPEPNFVKPEIDKVKVAFRVAPFSQRNQIVALRILNFPADTSIYIEEKSIILHYWVKREYENSFSADSFNVYVDFKKRNMKDSSLTPKANLPKIIAYHSFTPEKIKLKFKKNYRRK